MAKPPSFWNDELDDFLRAGINRGDSFRKIAADMVDRFRIGVTRSACISRSHRIIKEDRSITEADIDALRAAYDEGQTARAAARTVACPPAVAADYFDRFRRGYLETKPPAQSKFDPAAHRASRFYHSNFEL